MITRKELEYVNVWAKKTPFPGNDYSEAALEKLKTAFNLFNNVYKGNKYNIILSNNEELDLEIQEKNLAHMLGINFKNLNNSVFDDFKKNILDIDPTVPINSYRLLELILENSDKIIEFDANSYLRALNYYKISIRSDIFNKLGNLIDFGSGCINFNKEEFLLNSGFSRFNPNSTKFLYLPSDEAICPYFFMGICPTNVQESGNDLEEDSINVKTISPYFVETLFAPDQPEYFFQNQEVVIPTQILKINDKEMTKFSANASQKKQVLKEYENIIQLYDLKNKMNIYADYIASLSESEKTLTKSL